MKSEITMMAKFVPIPHGKFYYEYKLKMVPVDEKSSFGYRMGTPEEYEDVSSNYWGTFTVNNIYLPDDIKIGDTVQLGSYKVRIVDNKWWMAQSVCVLANPFSFLPILRRRLNDLWLAFLYRFIATLRIWGIMKPYQENLDVSVYSPAFPWRDIYAIDKLARVIGRGK